MSAVLELFSFLLVDLLVDRLTAESSFGNVHENLVSRWCHTKPFAILFSKGEYINCSERDSYVPESFRGRTMKGVTLRVGILESEKDRDFDCGVKSRGGEWVAHDNYSQYVLRLLQEVLQFEVEYVPASNCSTNLNGKARTLLGLMENNETDLTVCHWTVSDIVLEAADHVTPTLKTTEAFVFVPNNLPLTQDVFLGTFSIQLWSFFFLTIFLFGVSFKFATVVHSKVRPDRKPWTWDEVILWVVATVSQQSYSRLPSGLSCKMVFFIGYVISYLLYTGFAAGITSLLALNGHRSWLSFEDIYNMKLKLIFYHDEYYFDFPEQKNSKTSAPLASSLLHKDFDDLTGIFNKVLEENAVGYGTAVTFVHHLKKMHHLRREQYLVFPLPLYHRQKSFLVRKLFPYKDLFNYWLIKFTERGLIDLGERRYLENREVSLYKSKIWLSADLRNVSFAFVFLFGGWLVSSIILLLEIIYWNIKQRKLKR